MVLKLINATGAKSGTTILWEGTPCNVRTNDISKTGKHGSSKCRIEMVGIFDGKKRIAAIPGDTKLEVPLIEKKRAQVLSVSESNANIMDLESFETIDVPFAEEIKGQISAEKQVEYWDVEGHRVIMKVF